MTSPSFYLDILLVNDHYYKKNQTLMNDFTYLKLFVLRKLFEEKLAFDIYNNKIKIINE